MYVNLYSIPCMYIRKWKNFGVNFVCEKFRTKKNISRSPAQFRNWPMSQGPAQKGNTQFQNRLTKHKIVGWGGPAGLARIKEPETPPLNWIYSHTKKKPASGQTALIGSCVAESWFPNCNTAAIKMSISYTSDKAKWVHNYSAPFAAMLLFRVRFCWFREKNQNSVRIRTNDLHIVWELQSNASLITFNKYFILARIHVDNKKNHRKYKTTEKWITILSK